jgi:hypothetical protein
VVGECSSGVIVLIPSRAVEARFELKVSALEGCLRLKYTSTSDIELLGSFEEYKATVHA